MSLDDSHARPTYRPPPAMERRHRHRLEVHPMFDPQDTTGLDLVPGPDACPCKSSGCRSGWVWRPVAAPAEAQGSAAPAAQGVRGAPEAEPEGGS